MSDLPDIPSPESAVADGTISITGALMSMQIRRSHLEVYKTLVPKPEEFAPYADDVLDLTQQSIDILQRAKTQGLSGQDEINLRENANKINKAIERMVRFQVANDCWAQGQ